MNKKNLLIIILSLALLAGAVAVGIHVLHKEALAMVHYIVEIWDEELGQPVLGATVSMSFNWGIEWIQADELQNGKYEVIRDNYAGTWLIRIDEPDNYMGVNPPGNPIQGSATHAYQFWNVFLDDD